MSRLPRLSIKGKGSKVKTQPEAVSSFVESGSSVTAGGAHGSTTPQFAAGGTGMSSPGSQASGTFMASPGSPPPLLTSQELLSPDSTDSASETSLSKTEMKKLADKRKKADKEAESKAEEKRKEAEKKAEEKRKADKKEAEEKRKADKKEAEVLKKERKRKEEESKKSKGKKSDPKSPQDESSSYSEDSSTLVPWSAAIPGAAADLPLRELAVKSEHEAGHRGEMVSEATASVHQHQPRKMLVSSDKARFAESEKIRLDQTVQQLAATLQNVKRTEAEARQKLELELQQKEQELRDVLLRKDDEWQEREEQFAELMQAKVREYQAVLSQQQKVSQETLEQKASSMCDCAMSVHGTEMDGTETDETQKLKEVLQEKESEIRQLRKQQESYQKIATEFGALQEHSKKQMMQLRLHLDAAKIGETERAQYEQSLVESLHSLEDQYDKLMKDYQAVSRDRGFMEQSLTALKKRNEELVSKLQQCEAKMGELKQQEESARLQWESMRDDCRALHQKNQELLTEKQKLFAANYKLEEENKQFIDNVKKISDLGNDNADLQKKIIAIRKEKEDLWSELQAVKAEKDELAPFVVQPSKVPKSMEAKGRGSFGTVHVIEVNGIPCIAKRLHDILVGRGGEEAVGRQNQSLLDKFRRECVLLSRLRHPNIVQFMGVHYGRDPSDLTLIMECLHMDLEDCLETYHDIPLPLKLSILLDASYGLLHLHSQMPPIIHRDLSAANILLSASMTAKIADLGVSKYLDAQKQTEAPGAYAYMPPEAVNPEPSYDTKLDNFSFGAVTLYVATQKFPKVDDNSITVEAVQNHEMQIQKRIIWIQKMGDHCLCPLILQCLQDLPKKRPTTAKINEDLKQLSQKFPRKFQDVLKMQKQLEHLECETQKLLQEKAGMEVKIRQRIAQEILQGLPS